MKYTTNNEFQNFEFSEVHVNDIMYANGSFKIGLDDVKILPENSCNRDIRKIIMTKLFSLCGICFPGASRTIHICPSASLPVFFGWQRKAFSVE